MIEAAARQFLKQGWTAAGLAAAGLIHVAPVADGLTRHGQSALGIFVMAVVLWISGVVPLAVTGLMVLALLPTLGVMEPKAAFALFGNPAIFFILGAFILAAAMMASGLSRRMSLAFMLRFGHTPSQLCTGILLCCAAMSTIMPVHAVAAIIYPALTAITDSLGLEPRRSMMGRCLFLSMAWGCAAGGILTLLGGARAALAIGILQESTGITVDFVQWLIAAAPLSAAVLGVAWLILLKFFPPEVDDVSPAVEELKESVRMAGPLSGREKRVGLVGILTITAWILWGQSMGLATLALFCAFALFVLDAISWGEAEDHVNWGVFLLYGGAIALGGALTHTGATKWMAEGLLAGWGLSGYALLVLCGLTTFVLTEFISNAASVAVLLPVVLSVCQNCGIDPKIAMFSVGIPSGLAFILPVGSPPNAIAFSSGYYSLREIIVPGLLLAAASMTLYALCAVFVWPLLF